MIERLTPHGNSASGCPAILRSTGRWPSFVEKVRQLLAGASLPVTTYAPTKPLPFEWDGEDKEYNGQLFIAIRRVFRAARNGVEARQYATESAALVRRPLPEGEGVEARWAVKAADGQWWIITPYHSRIRAADLLPAMQFEPCAATAQPVPVQGAGGGTR